MLHFKRMVFKMRLFFLVCLLMNAPSVMASADFHFLGQLIKPGASQSWMQAVSSTQIPITVIHGAQAGPVLTLAAGIHGDEFPAIYALQRIKQTVQPQTLHGTLILLHLANLEGFHARRVALSPVDEKNLNRVFPGRSEGTLTEQMAYFLTEQVIARTDYLMDIHSGSWNQALLPHVYSPVLNNTALDAETLAFAKSLGIPHIVLYDERPNDPNHSISFPNSAQTRGKPALTLEVGQLGQTHEQDIARIVRSCLNAMHFLRMGVAKGDSRLQPTPILYQRLVSVVSTATGLFQPMVNVGQLVKQGQEVGWVSDYFGQRIATLRATVTGTVLMVKQTPPIRDGETTVEIAVRLGK